MDQAEINTIITECTDQAVNVYGTRVISVPALIEILQKKSIGEVIDSEYVFDFGKHKGVAIEVVASTPKGKSYLKWMLEQENIRKRTEFFAAATKLLGQKEDPFAYEDPAEDAEEENIYE